MQRIWAVWIAGVVLACGTPVWAVGDAALGKAVYTRLCASCHGATGVGDGAAAAAINPKPRNFRDAARMKAMTDARLQQVILKGGAAAGLSPLMPPWEAALKPGEVDHLIAFIRSLAMGK